MRPIVLTRVDNTTTCRERAFHALRRGGGNDRGYTSARSIGPEFVRPARYILAAPVRLSGLNSFGLLGTYLPRQCGIATFTKDLRDALVGETPSSTAIVLAMDDSSGSYRYPDDVRFQIRAQQQQDYRLAAEFLNINQIDVTFVQHEFGIYGGQDGSYVLDFVRGLRMPVITTLHTVLQERAPTQSSILSDLARVSDRVVVMSHVAERMLQDIYSIPKRKIAYIPHGIPDVPLVDPVFYKDQFGLEGRKVILTFGLHSPGKGIEHALEALPAVVKEHSDVAFSRKEVPTGITWKGWLTS